MTCRFLNKPKIAGLRTAILYILLGLTVFALCLSCSSPKNEAPKEEEMSAGSMEVYFFSSGPDQVLSSAEPAGLPADLSVTEVLDRLGRHLSGTYFSDAPAGEKAQITFEIQSIHHLKIPDQPLRIGVINMIDGDEWAKKHFFQGSYGGQATFYMIAATFLQPQNNRPLLDGMILRYNGKPFPETAHIDFTGIVTPERVRPLALQVVSAANSEQ